MKSTLFLLPLLIACGAPAGSPSVHLSLSQALAEEVAAVELLVFGASGQCEAFVTDPARTLSLPACGDELDPPRDPCRISRQRVSRSEAGSAVKLFVPAGNRYVVAYGLDAQNALVAEGCNGPVEVLEGKSARIDIDLRAAR